MKNRLIVLLIVLATFSCNFEFTRTNNTNDKCQITNLNISMLAESLSIISKYKPEGVMSYGNGVIEICDITIDEFDFNYLEQIGWESNNSCLILDNTNK